MTEVHAFSGGPPRASPGAANAVTQTASVPVPADSPCLVAWDGTRLVAGLTWEIASGPEAPVLKRNAPHVLRLPDRRARLAAADDGPCGSLLLAMAADLTTAHVPGASGTWAFIAEIPGSDPAPTIWMGVADIASPDEEDEGTDGGEGVSRFVRPRPGPELAFDDPDEALEELGERLEVMDIAGLAVRWHPGRETRRGRMIQGITAIAQTLELHDVLPDRPVPVEGDRDASPAVQLPVFGPPRQVPVRLLVGLGSGALALLAAVFVVLPMIEDALRAPPPPPPEMVSVQVASGAFAGVCTAALDAWWPRITGWRVESSGCALAGHLPMELALPEPGPVEPTGRPMVVWRQLVMESGRNQVLARSAADQRISTWPHEARVDANRLTLWRTESLPLVPAATDPAGDRPGAGEIRTRLAALWADAPGAVTVPDAGGAAGGLVTISTSGATGVPAVFSRAARVPGMAPARLVRSASGAGELVLAPVTPRAVPAALFDDTGGGTSG